MSRARYSRDNSTRYVLVFVLFLVGILLTVALYYVKTRAQSAQSEAQRLKYQIAQEREAITVLQAEIAHLENPERIRELAERELGLTSVEVEQFLSVENIDRDLPRRGEEKTDPGGQP